MSNEKILEEIRRLCDPHSLLVIHGNKLQKVTCPFRVRVLADITGWKEGDERFVERVMVTRDLKMVYLIGGNGYHYYLFKILLP